ncbi:MAG: HlyD family secretion protein [Nevskia sp.]|nr:HlyD family secretion protein [Nevskia sp.]
MLAGVVVVVGGGGLVYLTGGRYMSTDDAYLQAGMTSVSSSVPGRVIEVKVHDNQFVHDGDVLFQIDQAPYKVAVAEAQAKLGSARLQVNAQKSAYRQQMANVRQAQDAVTFAQREYDRQKHLLASGISSQAQFDRASHELESAHQQVVSAQQQLAGILAMLGGDADIAVDDHPSVQQAKAELDRTQLLLAYTSVRAHSDGIVTKVEQLQVGDYINPGNAMFSLMSPHVWVEANFKEDQLTWMRPGQKATVDIDAYPIRKFHAHVASVSPGTGSQFSALPPENATGNWVKVVQRLPVRLEIDDPDPAMPLRSGLSAVVEVDTGHRRKLFGGSPAADGEDHSAR